MTKTFEFPTFMEEAYAAEAAHNRLNGDNGVAGGTPVVVHFNFDKKFGDYRDETWALVPKDGGILVAPRAWIGKNVIFGEDVAIHQDTHIADNVFLGNGVIVFRNAVLKENVRVGMNSRIGLASTLGKNANLLDHVTVGIGCDIGIHAIIEKNAQVPDGIAIPEWHVFHVDGTMMLRKDAPSYVKSRFCNTAA